MRSEPDTTSGRRLLALVIGALLLGAASVGLDAATAHAATIGAQETLRPPAHMPVDFAGRRYSMGQAIPRGHVVLRRRVTVATHEHPAIAFTCPRGTVALSPATNEGSSLGFQVRDLAQYHRATRRFRLFAEAFPDAPGGRARGRIYLLCGPRSAR